MDVSKFVTKSSMPIDDLKAREKGARVRFHLNSKGVLYFSCGEIERGYCSDAVKQLYASGAEAFNEAKDQCEFCELSLDGGKTFMPCIKMKGKGRADVACW